MGKIKDFFYNIKWYIKNVFKWSPFLWEDRDWDYIYIMYVLKLKIKQLSKYINANKRYEGYERDVEKMNLCVKLLEKYTESFYDLEYMDFYHERCFSFDTQEEFNNLTEYFDKYKSEYRKVKKLYPEKDEVFYAFTIGSRKQEQVKRLIFTILINNLEQWWD